MRPRLPCGAAVLLALAACGPNVVAPPPPDDASVDASADVPTDLTSDAPPDVPSDALTDTPADASVDRPTDAPIVCGSAGGSFPMFSAACMADADCVAVIHQTDCCGNLRALGIERSQRAAFDAAEAVCRPMYPRCGCPTRGILADDERWTFSEENVAVACRAGRCTTSVRGM